MREFLVQYWLIILAAVIGFVNLLVSCFKKSQIKLVDSAFTKLLSKLPDIISKAESLSPIGQEKKSYVLGVCYAFLSDLTGKSLEEITFMYKDRISLAIEEILKTPQKKEVISND